MKALTDVLLLELSSEMALDESSFAGSTISDKNELEGGDSVSGSHLKTRQLKQRSGAEHEQVTAHKNR